MIYTDTELKEKIREMIRDFESEVVEFKEANNNYSFKDIGKYFSALGNEANIRGKSEGWLIFGITNKDDATVTPFRCYINPPSSSNAPAFINVNFDEGASITLVPNDAEPQKVKLYDLLGRPRKEASPGIFIKSTR